MPISFSCTDEGNSIEWRQSITPPVVFLDVWAIQEISESIFLRKNFSKILLKKNGTLLITPEVITELSIADDSKHAKYADSLIVDSLPNIYLTSIVNPFDEHFGIDKNFIAPPAAREILDSLARKGDIPLEIRLGRLFSDIHDARNNISYDVMQMSEKISQQIAELSGDPKFTKKAKNFRLAEFREYRLNFLAELIRDHVLNKTAFNKNDAHDLLHAWQALSYCDIAMLDKKWAERAERIRLRYAKHGNFRKFPSIFSKKADGISRFLSAIEDFGDGHSEN